MKIVFTGGGTLGSVTPLLTLADKFEQEGLSHKSDIYWIGVRNGPERELLNEAGLAFFGIFAGKLRRYFDIRNFFDPFLLCIGCFQSFFILLVNRPAFIVHAGSFVGVPVCWMGWLLGIPIIAIQLDIVPSLANILVKHCASIIFVSCKKAQSKFPINKSIISGIPVRKEIEDESEKSHNQTYRDEQKKILGIPKDKPVVCILGGGTGAKDLNELVWNSLSIITPHAIVIHSTGKGKRSSKNIQNSSYYQFEFITNQLISIFGFADIVVTRAGMGTLSELSIMGKPSIIIPLPHSHQEQNASYIESLRAGKYCSQSSLTPESFAKEILDLLNDTERKKIYSQNIKNVFPQNATQKIIDLILSIQ